MKKILTTICLASSLFLASIPLTQAETTQNDNTENTSQYISSSAITAKVKSALLTKKNIDSTKINVQTETAPNGKTIVILTGTQKSQELIDLAVLTAKGVSGVTKVVNKLTVAP